MTTVPRLELWQHPASSNRLITSYIELNCTVDPCGLQCPHPLEMVEPCTLFSLLASLRTSPHHVSCRGCLPTTNFPFGSHSWRAELPPGDHRGRCLSELPVLILGPFGLDFGCGRSGDAFRKITTETETDDMLVVRSQPSSFDRFWESPWAELLWRPGPLGQVAGCLERT